MKPDKLFNSVTSLLAFAVLLAACSSGSNEIAQTDTAEITTATVAPSTLALPYFEEIAKNTRVGYDAAAKISHGFALEYANYRNEYLQAIAFAKTEGETFQSEPLTTARLEDSGRILLESTENRITYSDFQLSRRKSLFSFKVEGRELSGNLKTGAESFPGFSGFGGSGADDFFGFNILHSYVSAAGDLIVTYSLQIGSEFSIVREDRSSKGLPNHFVVDSSGATIKATFGVETFARGEKRINVVAFGPLYGGGRYTANFKFRSDGNLYEFKDWVLGTFSG